MDSDVITLQRFLDPWENAIVTEENELSNAMLKFRRAHPAIAKACKKLVSRNDYFQVQQPLLGLAPGCMESCWGENRRTRHSGMYRHDSQTG